ncbi:MAG TPA: hypothetical protein VF469_39100 [Kofleriaceae bacterium]
MDVAAIRSYEALRGRVAAGELRLLLLLSPPRTGSTVLANALAQRCQIDALVTEPAAQHHLPRDTRVAETFQLIADTVEELASHGSPPQPLVVLVKEIAHHIGPGDEWRAWRGLFDRVLILVRRPILALESLIFMTLGLGDLLSGGADGRPERWLTREAQGGWPRSAVESWPSFLAHLKQTREFRGLDEDRLRAYWHGSAMLAMRSLQLDVWANEARRGRLRRSQDEIHRFAGTPLARLPVDLRRPFEDRHFAWSALRDLWENTATDDASLALVDFASVQDDPGKRLEALGEFFAARPRAPGGRPPLSRSAYDTRGEALHEVLFGEALARPAIGPTARAPLSIERLPAFLQAQLRDADAIYDRLKRDPRWR